MAGPAPRLRLQPLAAVLAEYDEPVFRHFLEADGSTDIVHRIDANVVEIKAGQARHLITAAVKTLPATNDALNNATLNNATLPQVSSTERRLRQRQGMRYRVTACFPRQVLNDEPSLQNLKPGALPVKPAR